jgi:hypothetical protein
MVVICLLALTSKNLATFGWDLLEVGSLASYNYHKISKDVLVLNNKECITFQIFIRIKILHKILRNHPTLN